MRVKKIRFPLKMRDDVEVRSLEDLRKNFDLEKVYAYFSDGKLEKWLENWHYPDEAEKIRSLDKSSDNRKAICEILGVNYDDSSDIDPEEISWRTKRLNRMKQYTVDPEILAKVDNVAFDVDDLFDILEEGRINDIYLCGKNFTFNAGILHFENKNYHGVGKVEIKIESEKKIYFDLLGITFDRNIKFDDKYQNAFNKMSNEELCIAANNFFYGYEGYPINKKKSFELYEQAAKNGSDSAKRILVSKFLNLSTFKEITSKS